MIKIITKKTIGAVVSKESMEFQDIKIANTIAKLINTHSLGTTAEVESDIVTVALIHTISVDERLASGLNVTVDDVEIDDDVFNKEMVDYKYEKREKLIERIREMWCEASESDKMLMDEDVDSLKGLDDEYVFSSISTNEYISPTENTQAFNDICIDMLEANKNVV